MSKGNSLTGVIIVGLLVIEVWAVSGGVGRFATAAMIALFAVLLDRCAGQVEKGQ